MINRVKDIICHYGLSNRAFALKCGIPQNTFNNQLNGVRELSLSTINAILKTYEGISAEWLMRGTGNMLISENIDSDSNLDRINKLVDTITTLQDAINEKTKTIKVLEEEIKNLKRKQ